MSTQLQPKMVKITVDGAEVEVPEGAILIEALKMQGLDIPNFCYYRNLPAQASCRMCLVRVDKVPRLQPSCTTAVREGMVVFASSEEIVEARRAMLEFTLANHPLDCPVCDRGGECELQDMVFKFGHVDARFTEVKHPTPEVDISPFIYNDAQRCVFCYRCTRVCDLWMDVGALAKLERGSHETIGTFDGWLDCEHCGNCVDVCPTGTLMHTSYKYGPRPWDLTETESTCNHCADGCRVRLSSRGDVVHRSVARQGTGINEEYLCVKGRYGMDFINSETRLTQPLVRRDGELTPVSWDEALDHVAARMREIAEARGPNAIGVLGSRRVTNEGNLATAGVARAIATNNLSYVPDYDLATFFENLGGRLARKEDILRADLVFVLGGDPKEFQPLTAYFVLQAHLRAKTEIVAAGSRMPRMAKRAKQFLRARPGSEAALLAALADDASAAKMAPIVGCTVEEIDALRAALGASKRLVVMVGPELRGAALQAAASLGTLLAAPGDGDRDVSYRPLVGFANSVGAHDVITSSGGTSDFASFSAKLGSDVSALYAVGSDLLNEPDGAALREALAKLDLLVVQDLFMTDLAAMAEVVLPASSFAEQEGTFTNIAGEVQRCHKSIEPVGYSRPDWLIGNHLARVLGTDLGFRHSPAVAFKRLAETAQAYAGVSYQRLSIDGIVPTERPSGSAPRNALVLALVKQADAVDASVPLDESVYAMGEGLFAIGTTTSHSRLLSTSFADGRATGRPFEEEYAS
jgi:NADH-quinone oxidoreductase subunit G